MLVTLAESHPALEVDGAPAYQVHALLESRCRGLGRAWPGGEELVSCSQHLGRTTNHGVYRQPIRIGLLLDSVVALLAAQTT